MQEHLAFDKENCKRIRDVEHSFRPTGKPLCKTGRILIGEGRLMKMCRRQPQPKVFFLFNDILVYGSIVINGRLYSNQKIIPLEDIIIEDLEDGVRMTNQWLIRTPRKSFYVGAASREEKRAWMDHIEDSRSTRLRSAGCEPNYIFAVTWIPDQASAICMRCATKFTMTQRRHHCRHCGFLVCGPCSKYRSLIAHIHPTRPLRVCAPCYASLPYHQSNTVLDTRPRGNSDGKSFSDDDSMLQDCEASGDEDEQVENESPSWWLQDPHSTYVYLKPEHESPESTSHPSL